MRSRHRDAADVLAELAEADHSLLSRLVLGVQFDVTDILWYPIGIAPLVALHHALRHHPATQPHRDRRTTSGYSGYVIKPVGGMSGGACR
jgi:hypothetical protein